MLNLINMNSLISQDRDSGYSDIYPEQNLNYTPLKTPQLSMTSCQVCNIMPEQDWTAGACAACENETIPTPFFSGRSVGDIRQTQDLPLLCTVDLNFVPNRKILNAPGGESWQFYTAPVFNFACKSPSAEETCIWREGGKQLSGCTMPMPAQQQQEIVAFNFR